MRNKLIPVKFFVYIFFTVFLLTAFQKINAGPGDFIYKFGDYYSFSFPEGIAINNDGNTYVVDTAEHKIKMFTNDGIFIKEWGKFGSGISPTPDDAFFNTPTGIAIDENMNIYIVDSNNHRIQVFNSAGLYLYEWGVYGVGEGQFRTPLGIAIDKKNYIYVTDSENHRIQVFNNIGEYLYQWGSHGYEDGLFSLPKGIAVNKNSEILVTDFTSRVQMFTSEGAFIRQFGGEGFGNGKLNYPSGLVVDDLNNVYVADTNNDQIQVFNSTGIFVRKWGEDGSGCGSFSSPYGLAIYKNKIFITDSGNNRVEIFTTSGQFLNDWASLKSPYSVTVDSNNKIYVTDTDNHRIVVYNSTGIPIKKWGDGPNGLNGTFNYPAGIAVAKNGNVFVADTWNNRIQAFNSNGVFLRKWGGYGSLNGQFNFPWAIAMDSRNYIYVADSNNNRIQVFDTTGRYIKKYERITTGSMSYVSLLNPRGIAIDKNDNIFIVSGIKYSDSALRYEVIGFTKAAGFITRWKLNLYDDSLFIAPHGIAIDKSGYFYITNQNFNKIGVFTRKGTPVMQLGSSGSGIGQFDKPMGLAVSPNGLNLYVSESRNDRIQAIEAMRSTPTAFAGPDQTIEQTSVLGAYANLGEGISAPGVNYKWTWSYGSSNLANPKVLMRSGTTEVTLTASNNLYSSTGVIDKAVITVRDTIKPISKIKLTGTKDINGNYITDVLVNISASDSGSGVKEISYKLDSTAIKKAGASASFNVITNGLHTVVYNAVDMAGNIENIKSMRFIIKK